MLAVDKQVDGDGGQVGGVGVRDAANLCWKLDGVLRGELPESVLDSYEAERKPHVKQVTRRAVFVGRIITERRLPVTRARNVALRALNRVPGCGNWLQDSPRACRHALAPRPPGTRSPSPG